MQWLTDCSDCFLLCWLMLRSQITAWSYILHVLQQIYSVREGQTVSLNFAFFCFCQRVSAQHKLTLTQDFVSVNITFNVFQCSYIVLLWKRQSKCCNLPLLSLRLTKVVHLNQYNCMLRVSTTDREKWR